MSWAKIDDQFAMHPKTVRAGNEAIGCWVRMLAWSSAQLTDGFVPHMIASLLAEGNDAVLDRLRNASLLEKHGDDYQIHDYLDWNPSAAEVRKTRKERAKAGARGGKQKASKRLANCQDFASTMLKQNPTPSRTRPVPVPSSSVVVLEGQKQAPDGATPRAWPSAIASVADLELAIAAWGWSAVGLGQRERARARRIVTAGPIQRHEWEAVMARTMAKTNGGRVRYFLGAVEGCRQDAENEAAKASPKPRAPPDEPVPEYMRRNFTQERIAREREEQEGKANGSA